MQNESNIDKRTDRGSGSSEGSGLLAKIRNRTEREQNTSSSVTGSPYSAAALGQAPYVAMGNGVIIVQRKCHDWNC
jgi:hypothetical protein